MRFAFNTFLTMFVALAVASMFGLPIMRVALQVPSVSLPAIPEGGDRGPQAQHRIPVDQVSTAMKEAMLAAEDHRFYEHQGVDGLGVFRAIMDNIKAGHMIEGASTIPQQLAKVVFLDGFERTPRRKLTQLVMVNELESKYSKERILESYFNCVYFGRGAYSIEDAAHNYFGVRANQLDVAQGAFIAGCVRSPSILGSPAHLDKAIERQHQVIDNMAEYGYITDKEAQAAKKEELAFRSSGKRADKRIASR